MKRSQIVNPQDYIGSPLSIIFIAIVLIRVVMDLYVFKNTLAYFIFIIRKRMAFFRKRGRGIMPCRSKIMIGWLSIVLTMILFEILFIFGVGISLPSDHD